MAKHLAQIIVNGVQIVARAFARAVQNEIRTSQQAAKARSSSSSNNPNTSTTSASGMSLQEAKQVLNITDHKEQDKVLKNYDHLFKVNDKSIGGSFYIQSKVVRAKERIDEELGVSTPDKEKKKDSEES